MIDILYLINFVFMSTLKQVRKSSGSIEHLLSIILKQREILTKVLKQCRQLEQFMAILSFFDVNNEHNEMHFANGNKN